MIFEQQSLISRHMCATQVNEQMSNYGLMKNQINMYEKCDHCRTRVHFRK